MEKKVESSSKYDMWRRIKNLEERGYEVTFPMTLFRETTFDGGVREIYRAKMRKKEGVNE